MIMMIFYILIKTDDEYDVENNGEQQNGGNEHHKIPSDKGTEANGMKSYIICKEMVMKLLKKILNKNKTT